MSINESNQSSRALESLKAEISQLDSKLGDIKTEVQGQQKKFALLSHAINLLKEGNDEPPVPAPATPSSRSGWSCLFVLFRVAFS